MTGLLTPWAERRGCKEVFGRRLELEGGRVGEAWLTHRLQLGLGVRGWVGLRNKGIQLWVACVDVQMLLQREAAPATRLRLQDNMSLCIYTILSRRSWFTTKELGVDAEAQRREWGLPVSSGVQASFLPLSSKRLDSDLPS